MKKKKLSDQLKLKIAESDPERLNGYIEMFDRLLLYNIAASMLPPDAVNEMIEKWEDTVKSAIDMESCMRTHFLESTPQGRIAKQQKQPDGEDLRLLSAKTLDAAKMILIQNLQPREDDSGSHDLGI